MKNTDILTFCPHCNHELEPNGACISYPCHPELYPMLRGQLYQLPPTLVPPKSPLLADRVRTEALALLRAHRN